MKKNVGFLIGSLANGGAERVVSNLTMNLSEDKYNIHIILFGDAARIEYPYKGNIITLDKMKCSRIVEKIHALIKRTYAIYNIKKKYNMDCMISFLHYQNLLNLITKRKSGKTVISIRIYLSKTYEGIKGTIWKAFAKRFYERADEIIAVSEEIKKDLTNNYSIKANKIKVIYNSYPLEMIKDSANEKLDVKYQELFKHPVVITSGRITPQKGQVHIIRAFSKVKIKIPDARLVILGSGPLEQSLKCLASDLGIADDVHFLGFQQNPFKYISRSRVFVLASLFEGFPNVLAEAMVCGVPVISSDCLSGPREILAPNKKEDIQYEIVDADNYGILVPVPKDCIQENDRQLSGEEALLAERICNLLEDRELWQFFKDRSTERSSHFNIDNIIGQWEETFCKKNLV